MKGLTQINIVCHGKHCGDKCPWREYDWCELWQLRVNMNEGEHLRCRRCLEVIKEDR